MARHRERGTHLVREAVDSSPVSTDFCELSVGGDDLNRKGLAIAGGAEAESRSCADLSPYVRETIFRDDGPRPLATDRRRSRGPGRDRKRRFALAMH